MPSIEYSSEHADELAQEVVNAWGLNTDVGNMLPETFLAVLDNACCYRGAKRVADNQREHNVVSAEAAAKEKTTRQEFAEAYKIYQENPRTAQ